MKKNKYKILITGADGFVGKALTEFLKNKNYIIIKITKKNYDLSKKNEFKKIFLKYNPDFIVHLAARTFSKVKNKKEDCLQFKHTYMPIKNLVDNITYCKNLKKIIFCGTIEEYGKSSLPYREKDQPKPTSSYGFAKYSGHKYVLRKIKENNYNYTWLRPSLMFGPNDNVKRLLGSIFFNLKRNKIIKINLGLQKRDFLYVYDFCKIIFYHIKFYKKFNYKLANISSKNWLYIKDLLKILKKRIDNKKFKLIKVNYVKDKSVIINSVNLLRKFHPELKFTPFHKSLKITLNSYGL